MLSFSAQTPSGRRLKLFVAMAATCLLVAAVGSPLRGALADVVVYSSDLTTVGQWAKSSDGSAAGGQYVTIPDAGWSSADAALAAPGSYVQGTVSAELGVTYRVWLRLRAAGNSKWNDSVWVQFSDATDTGGSPAYRIGTTSGLAFNLESCKDCG